MSIIAVKHYHSPLGELLLGVFEEKLCICDWAHRKKRANIDTRIKRGLKSDFAQKENSLFQLTIKQLEEYFSGNRKQFDLPLLTVGSDFQKEVWNELLKIDYGQTLSYKALSDRMKSPLAIRAIAAANGANSLAIIIPCHRIIGANNDLVGYAGGLKAKSKLLEMEDSLKKSQQLLLF